LGIAPLLIFCCAIFSVCWGIFAGLMVKRVNMGDLEGVKQCILDNAKDEATLLAIGGEK